MTKCCDICFPQLKCGKRSHSTTQSHGKMCNFPLCPCHALPLQMDTHAEVALPAGGDNIFKPKKSVAAGRGAIKYISGFLIVRNTLMDLHRNVLIMSFP